MIKELQTFWRVFWLSMKTAYNTVLKKIPKELTQPYEDTKRINFLSIFVSKLNNLANTEATFDIESDSTPAQPLKKLIKDLEAKRFEITSEMLGNGDLWVFPATDSGGTLYHSIAPQAKVRILKMDGEKITDLLGVIDEYVDDKNNTYLLNRRHTLNHRTLTIETYTTNERNERVQFNEWADLEGTYQLNPVDFIGVGRFKSPVSGRGHSPVYGVPLNFGCEEIEKKCFNDLQLIETEFERAESKLFADGRTLRKMKTDKGEEFKLIEGVFSVERRAGDTGKMVDIFSPEIRYSAYYSKLVNDMAQYEQLIGTDRGFLTPFESGHSATATEIRRANASTIALLDRIHEAIKMGVRQTIKADAMLLNTSEENFTISFDFFDVFTDEEAQYQRLANAVDRGIAEKADELQWLFPSLSVEEREEKLARIDANKGINEDEALERMLRGE